MVLAFFLLYVVVLQSVQGAPGPSVATSAGLLITVVLCVYIGFSMAFADKRTKNWKKALLVVGLICGSAALFYLGLVVLISGGILAFNAPLNNTIIAGYFLYAIAAIQGLAGILALILTLDKYLVEADIKPKVDKR